MKIKEFTYTKANGDVSRRTLVVLVNPTTAYEGIDASSLTDDAFAEFIEKCNDLEKEIATMRAKLYAEFDLTYDYRRFVPERMTHVTEIYA